MFAGLVRTASGRGRAFTPFFLLSQQRSHFLPCCVDEMLYRKPLAHFCTLQACELVTFAFSMIAFSTDDQRLHVVHQNSSSNRQHFNWTLLKNENYSFML